MRRFVALQIVAVSVARLAGAGVAETPHNLSFSSTAKVRSTSESELCAFCHVPHEKQPMAGAWSKATIPTRYLPYESSTLSQPVGQPDGASRLCLACHDGTIAITSGRMKKARMQGLAAGGVLSTGPSNLGTDLRDDHPVSMPIPSRRAEIHAPRDKAVRLDRGGKVQCTSCHDAHKQNGDPLQHAFLVGNNSRSALCLACHTPKYWATPPAAHQSSLAPFRPEDGNHTKYPTVAETGCESCHKPHTALTPERNLKGIEEGTCLVCHAGRVSQQNVMLDFRKTYAHPTLTQTPSVHDAAEGPDSPHAQLPERSPAAPRHAECPDCHDAHAATHREVDAPFASGALAAVWGIDRNGTRVDEVRYEYEVCFKCHADSVNEPARFGRTSRPFVRRQIAEANLRVAFDPQGPSSHPVVGMGKNPSVPGLKNGLTPASQIRCTDCHASDDGKRSPHGSIYASILSRNYVTDDLTPESPQAYALCYGCHDRQVLLSAQSGFAHERHVARDQAPCSACHDPHGVSQQKGADAVGNAHLVNFDLGIVAAGSRKMVRYQSGGPGRGSCTLQCHGHDHVDSAYGPAATSAALRRWGVR